jgi:protein TonB
MITLLSFTSTQVLLALAGVGVAVTAVIAVMRFAMNRNSNKLLNRTDNLDNNETSMRYRTKYPQVDAFNYSSTFTLLGIATSLFLINVLVSWTTFEEQFDIPVFDMEIVDDVIVEPPRTAEPPPPPPPPPPPVIQEVPDEVVLEEDDLEFMDQSIDAETTIDVPDPVTVADEAVDAPPPPPPPPAPDEEEIFKIVEQMPRFPGCDDMPGTNEERTQCANQKLYEFLYKHIQYPTLARENNIQGNVVISFVVNKDGSIVDAQVLREPGAGCGEEALRVIQLMNAKNIKWTPGKQRGKPVRVQFILPIRFALA